MREYYNKLSEQKRIAFIDNLTDDQAKTLSEKYPFAICFASNTSTDKPFPVIWYNNKRYGFTSISTDVITINDVLLQLKINEAGQLQLYSNSAIDTYRLISVKNRYDINQYGDSITPTGNIYTVHPLFNKIILNFAFVKDGQDIENVNYDINFNTNNNYYIIEKNTDSIGLTSYILTIKKSTTDLQNHVLPLNSNLIINGQQISIDPINFTFIKTPETVIWQNGNNIISNNVLNIYTNEQGSTDINFKFPTGESADGFEINLYCEGNNNKLNSSSLQITQNIKDLIFNYLTNNSLISGNFYISIEDNEHKKQLEASKLTVSYLNSNNLFYVGSLTTANSVINNGRYEGTLESTPQRDKWVEFRNYDFSSNSYNISVNQNTIIVLPTNYKLALPLYNNDSLTDPMDDPMWTLDNTQGNQGEVEINGTTHKVYKYDTNYYGGTNLLDEPKLLSIIVHV